jgi:hypothetical protein
LGNFLMLGQESDRRDNVLRIAFKEWAVICRALALGRQAIILRKGGIAEDGGEFRPEHNRFWLYPTYLHQQRSGLRPDAAAMLDEVEKARPPDGAVQLSHFAEVAGIYHVHSLAGALALTGLHLWSLETVTARFAYWAPGVYVLPVRIYQAPAIHELAELPAYAGCRTWVELERELATEGATPVLSEEAFREVLRTLDERLRPTAWV